jgi:hypothetical protein
MWGIGVERLRFLKLRSLDLLRFGFGGEVRERLIRDVAVRAEVVGSLWHDGFDVTR